MSHCVPNPCLNNGTCVSWKDGYLCHCSENYIGGDCQKDKRVIIGLGLSAGIAIILSLLIIGCIILLIVKYRNKGEQNILFQPFCMAKIFASGHGADESAEQTNQRMMSK